MVQLLVLVNACWYMFRRGNMDSDTNYIVHQVCLLPIVVATGMVTHIT
jgi:hypothetical protein